MNFLKRNIGRFCDFFEHSPTFETIVKANLLLARYGNFFFLILLLICIKIGLSHEMFQFRWFVQFSVWVMASLHFLIVLWKITKGRSLERRKNIALSRLWMELWAHHLYHTIILIVGIELMVWQVSTVVSFGTIECQLWRLYLKPSLLLWQYRSWIVFHHIHIFLSIDRSRSLHVSKCDKLFYRLKMLWWYIVAWQLQCEGIWNWSKISNDIVVTKHNTVRNNYWIKWFQRL